MSDNVLGETRALISQLKPHDTIEAIKTVTLKDLQHLAAIARDRPLNAETVKMLFEEAMKTHSVGTTAIAAALVIYIIIVCFPLAAVTPFLAALGFTSVGPAAASIAATFQSFFGVNAVFSLLQSAAMAGYGAPVVAGIVQGASAIGATFAGFGLWGRR